MEAIKGHTREEAIGAAGSDEEVVLNRAEASHSSQQGMSLIPTQGPLGWKMLPLSPWPKNFPGSMQRSMVNQ